MKASCEFNALEDDSDEHFLEEEVWSDEQLWFDDFEDYLTEDLLAATDEEYEHTTSDEEGNESDCSEEEGEQSPIVEMTMVPIIAEAPRVLESCLHIERVPGVCQVKTNSFRICGDNIDKTIRRRFLRSDRSNTSLHYFHSYAVLNRIDFSNLSDSLPDNSTITNLENVAVSLQPTKLDDQILQDNIGMLISRILCTRMSFFRVCFQDLVHWHIKHKYTPEMSQKSVVVRTI